MDTVIEGLRTTALGMGVVFLSLGALYYVLHLSARMASRTAKPASERDQARRDDVRVSSDASPGVSPEIAAVIASVLSLEGVTGGIVRVRSVERPDC
jgi:Na+-transporting methylmalonyl-CoA/oxaloacetate decarboxylase gamma subunit